MDNEKDNLGDEVAVIMDKIKSDDVKATKTLRATEGLWEALDIIAKKRKTTRSELLKQWSIEEIRRIRRRK